MNIQTTAIAGLAIALASTAQAGVTTIAEFESLQFEGFNDMQSGFVRENISIFNGMGEVLAGPRGSWIHATSQWGYSNGDWRGTTRAYEGAKMLGNTRGAITYQFNEAQRSFGGFFATIANEAGGTIKFYDANDQLVGDSTVNAAVGGEWSWNGWTLDQNFTRVDVTANYRDGAGGFLMHDSIRVSNMTIPAPGAMALLLTGGLIATRRRRH